MTVTTQVDDNLVRPIVEAEIRAAIVRQLENIDDLVPKLVKAVLRTEVDSTGKISDRKYNNRHDLLDVICRDAIQQAARAAMREYIEESADELRVEVKRQIEASSSRLAKVFVDSLVGSLETSWRFTVKVILPGQDE
jgi:hypothetical protein